MYTFSPFIFSLQPRLKRSSGVSTILFISLPFSVVMQKILPSIVHTFPMVGPFLNTLVSFARKGVRSSFRNTPFRLRSLSHLLFFMSAVFMLRRTNLTMMGLAVPCRPGSQWLTLMSFGVRVTPISATSFLMMLFVFSSSVSGMLEILTESLRLYWFRWSNSNFNSWTSFLRLFTSLCFEFDSQICATAVSVALTTTFTNSSSMAVIV